MPKARKGATAGRPKFRAVVAITGASGIAYAVRLVEELAKNGTKPAIVVTKAAKTVMGYEEGNAAATLARLAKLGTIFEEDDFSAPFASGSSAPDAFVVCPCSMKTLSAIANGYSHNLVARGAEVALKERRKLILVPREMPFTAIQLENMLKLARLGAVIMPPQPAFYNKPKTLQDAVDFVAGKILDSIGIENSLYERWNQ